MKLSDQQAQILLQTLTDSLEFEGYPYKYSFDTRKKLADQIISQQSTVPRELGPE